MPRLRTPGEQLDHARHLKTLVARTEPGSARRARAVGSAVDAYRALRTHHPEALSLCAEAAFRAGSLLASAGMDGEAITEFGEARRLGAETEFGPRSGLELGRLYRRSGDLEASFEAYFAVATRGTAGRGQQLEGVDPRYRNEAWLRVGDAWDERGAPQDARRAWNRVATAARDVRQRALAFDRIGLSWLRAGDIEAAAGVLAECRGALRGVSLQRGVEGERARRALRSMRLIDALRSAIEKRMKDARGQPVDRERRARKRMLGGRSARASPSTSVDRCRLFLGKGLTSAGGFSSHGGRTLTGLIESAPVHVGSRPRLR